MLQKNRKTIFALFISIIFIVISIFIFDVNIFENYKSIDLKYALLSFIPCLIIYWLSGFQLFKVILKVQIKPIEVFFYPIIMNLWSFIIPFQGALFFSTIYLKTRLGKSISNSIGITLFLYSITVTFTGLIAIIYFLSDLDKFNLLFIVISFLFLSNPLIFFLLSKFDFSNVNTSKFFSKVSLIVKSIFESVQSLYLEVNTLIKLFLIRILKTILMGIWYFFISKSLGFSIGIQELLLLGLINELAIIIKITPNNLGINEFMSGIVFTILGQDSSYAVSISLFSSFSTILIIFTVGILGNYLFLKTLNVKSVLNKHNDEIL